MAPLIVQVIATLIARIVLPWRDAARMGMAAMFFFTAVSHFAPMIPPPLTGELRAGRAGGLMGILRLASKKLPVFMRLW